VAVVTQWWEQRERAVAARGAALESQRAAEATKGRMLIADFVREALAGDLPPEPLTCLSYNGRTRFRTGLKGWYLDRKRIIAVDVSGNYYLLLVPHGFWARFTGVTPQPQEPRLIVGEGGRDGESMPLRDLLARRLGRTA
jgi:hypothetical protein